MKQNVPFLKILAGWFLLSSGFLLSACSSANPTGTCAPADFFVAGSWQSAFRCQDDNPSFGCFTGTDTLTLSQDGSSAQPGNNLSFTDSNGGSFSGQLCGSTFTWTGTGPGITEEGTWEFSDAQNFSKTTQYERTDGSGGGDCEGDGTEVSLAIPVAPTCP